MGFHYIRRYFHQNPGNTFSHGSRKKTVQNFLVRKKTSPSHPHPTGCFLKWWYPQNTPRWSFLVGKPMVVRYHHFRNPPTGVVFARFPVRRCRVNTWVLAVKLWIPWTVWRPPWLVSPPLRISNLPFRCSQRHDGIVKVKVTWKVREISMLNRGGGRSFERFFFWLFYWKQNPSAWWFNSCPFWDA